MCWFAQYDNRAPLRSFLKGHPEMLRSREELTAQRQRAQKASDAGSRVLAQHFEDMQAKLAKMTEGFSSNPRPVSKV